MNRKALLSAKEMGAKDFAAGWKLENNPYMLVEHRKMWRRGWKQAKGREYMTQKRRQHPDAHLGAVCA